MCKTLQLLPALTVACKRLPRELRRFIPLAQPVKPLEPASTSTSALSTRQPSPALISRSMLVADDVGAPVSRADLLHPAPATPGKPAARPPASPAPRAPSPSIIPDKTEPARYANKTRAGSGDVAELGGRAGARVAAAEDVGPKSPRKPAAAAPAASEWSVLPPAPAPVPPPPHDQPRKLKKKKRADGGFDDEGGGALAPVKKKKRKPKAGDEIDDIFG